MTSPLLMYSTAILDQVNLFLRTLMRILRFLRTLRRVLRKSPETVVPPLLSEHIFAPNGGYCIFNLRLVFRNKNDKIQN